MGNIKLTADVILDMETFRNLDKFAPRAMQKAAKKVLEEAVMVARKNSRVDTGAMQSGWKIDSNAGSAGGLSGAGNIVKATDQAVWAIYNMTVNSYGSTYTEYHEYGTDRFEAQPMLAPAVDYINANLEREIMSGFGYYKDTGRPVPDSSGGINIDIYADMSMQTKAQPTYRGNKIKARKSTASTRININKKEPRRRKPKAT